MKHRDHSTGLSLILNPSHRRSTLLAPVLGFLLCASTLAQTETVIISMPIQPLRMTKDAAGQTAFEDVALQGAAGQPALPYLTLKVLLPPTTELQSVKAVLRETKTTELPDSIDLQPMPPAVSTTGRVIWPEGAKIVDGRDVAAYATDAFTPAHFLQTCSAAQMRQWRIAEVTLVLGRYNPTTKTLMLLDEGKIELSYARQKGAVPLRGRATAVDSRFRQMMKDGVVNFSEMVGEYDEAHN